MNTSIAVKVTDASTGFALHFSFDRLPIRIGRNPLNQLRLDLPFVSQFHAVVEDRDGRLSLRDLGSRNGVTVYPIGRAPEQTSIDLAPANNAFSIGSLQFELTLSGEGVAAAQAAGVSLLALLGPRPRPMSAQQAELAAARADWAVQGAGPLYQQYRESWEHLFGQLSVALSQIDEHDRGPLLEALHARFPLLGNEPQFTHFLRSFHAAPTSGASDRRGAETTALLGLQHLLSTLTGSEAQLSTSDDVLGLLQRLLDFLQVFTRVFIPVRDGFRELGSALDGRSTPNGESESVDTARTPEALARAILVGKGTGDDAANAVQAAFTDVMMHQTTTLEGVANGVQKLFAELSPQSIEAALKQPNADRYGSTLGPLKYRAMWRAYAERHSDYADEQGHTFTLVFGKGLSRARGRTAAIETPEQAQPRWSAPPAALASSPPVARPHMPSEQERFRSSPPPPGAAAGPQPGPQRGTSQETVFLNVADLPPRPGGPSRG